MQKPGQKYDELRKEKWGKQVLIRPNEDTNSPNDDIDQFQTNSEENQEVDQYFSPKLSSKGKQNKHAQHEFQEPNKDKDTESVAGFLQGFMTNPFGEAFMKASTDANMLPHIRPIQSPPEFPNISQLRQRRIIATEMNHYTNSQKYSNIGNHRQHQQQREPFIRNDPLGHFRNVKKSHASLQEDKMESQQSHKFSIEDQSNLPISSLPQSQQQQQLYDETHFHPSDRNEQHQGQQEKPVHHQELDKINPSFSKPPKPNTPADDQRQVMSAVSLNHSSIRSAQSALPVLRTTCSHSRGPTACTSNRHLSSRSERRHQQRHGLKLSFQQTKWAVGTKRYLRGQMLKQSRAIKEKQSSSQWVDAVEKQLNSMLEDLKHEMALLQNDLVVSGMSDSQAAANAPLLMKSFTAEYVRATYQRRQPHVFLSSLKQIIPKLVPSVQEELEYVVELYASVLSKSFQNQRLGCIDDKQSVLNAASPLDDFLFLSEVQQQLTTVHGLADFDTIVANLGVHVSEVINNCRRKGMAPRQVIRKLVETQRLLKDQEVNFDSEIEREKQVISAYLRDIETADDAVLVMRSEMHQARSTPQFDHNSEGHGNIEAMHREIILNMHKQARARSVRDRACVPRRVVDWLEASITNAKGTSHLIMPILLSQSDIVWWKKQAELLRLDVADLNARVRAIRRCATTSS
eukprot:gene7974-10046_t